MFNLIWGLLYSLTLFLIALKLTLYTTWSWWLVFAPLWGPPALGVFVLAIGSIMTWIIAEWVKKI